MNKVSEPTKPVVHPSEIKEDLLSHWFNLERSSHLIILVPANSDFTTITRRICRLANEAEASIQLLGLYKDESEELALRRELVILSALFREAKVFVEMVIERGTDWVGAVRHNYRAGDTIVCLEDQPIGIRRRPLSQILESNFEAPIYILSNPHPQQLRSSLLSQLMAWSGLLALIAGFFILQVRIIQVAKGGFQTVLLILLLLQEIWLIQYWNSRFS